MKETESTTNRAEDEHERMPRQVSADIGMLQWILASTQEQIRFADSKAAFALLIQTFLFGFVASQVDTFRDQSSPCFAWALLLALAGYIGSSLASVIYAVRAVIPKFGEGAPRCKIFFGHIVSTYARNYDAYRRDVEQSSEDDWRRDLSSQIVENSNIALMKHRRAAVAAKWALAAFFLVFAALGIRLLGA